jgi:hypothetical protein
LQKLLSKFVFICEVLNLQNRSFFKHVLYSVLAAHFFQCHLFDVFCY